MKEQTFEYSEDVVSKAMMFAISAHSGQFRKSQRTPAIIHSMEAAVIASTMTDDQEVMAAALLHDTVEDTDVTIEQIKKMFSEKVSKLVASETEDKMLNIDPKDSWQIRKETSIKELKETDDIDVKILWLSDKLSNIRSFYRLKEKEGDQMWRYFNQKNPHKHEWYYRSVAEAVPELKDTFAYQEYVYYIDKIFGKNREE